MARQASCSAASASGGTPSQPPAVRCETMERSARPHFFINTGWAGLYLLGRCYHNQWHDSGYAGASEIPPELVCGGGSRCGEPACHASQPSPAVPHIGGSPHLLWGLFQMTHPR
ncbi:hypothetical protein HaLaN_26808 [Haematococcus lacustris]|uniref:Uncharacterized protein n=1 Tax=Haematococcus lacustris TaxID=44745 RepID=A0A6A0A768_HAELA|nr:hypothetical protein HaLaN_26808 [Haematococcus lacustris]